MRITSVSYAMLRQTKQFENDRVEIVVALEGLEGEEPAEVAAAVKLARSTCERALKTRNYDGF